MYVCMYVHPTEEKARNAVKQVLEMEKKLHEKEAEDNRLIAEKGALMVCSNTRRN